MLPSLSVSIAYVSAGPGLYRAEQRHRNSCRARPFGRDVSPVVVENSPGENPLNVSWRETRTLTIMFFDIRGFTSSPSAAMRKASHDSINSICGRSTDPSSPMGHHRQISAILSYGFLGTPPLEIPTMLAFRRAASPWCTSSRLDQRLSCSRASSRGEEQIDVNFRDRLATGDCCVGTFGSLNRFDIPSSAIT